MAETYHPERQTSGITKYPLTNYLGGVWNPDSIGKSEDQKQRRGEGEESKGGREEEDGKEVEKKKKKKKKKKIISSSNNKFFYFSFGKILLTYSYFLKQML